MKRAMGWIVLMAVSAAAISVAVSAALADEWRTLVEQHFSAPPDFSARHELVIGGENESAALAEVWVRLDDSASVNYNTRVNRLVKLPAGSFEIRIPLSGLRTPSGQALNLNALRYLHVFQKLRGSPITVTRWQFVAPEPLPPGVQGWDFGASDSAVFPGFEPVFPGDSRLRGGGQRAVVRPSGDALVSDGIAGVEQFRAAVSPGRWRLTLWLDDLGEWEYVPHDLLRTVRVNGMPILEQRWSEREWLERVYLAQGNREALLDGDPWEVLGRHRGGVLTRDIEITGDSLVVELAGPSPTAQYIAGALIEPVEPGDVHQHIEAKRASRFRGTWRVDVPAPATPVQKLTLWQLGEGEALIPTARPGVARHPGIATLVAAPGTRLTVNAAVLAPTGSGMHGRLWLRLLRNSEGVELPTTLRTGQWYFQRDENLLRVRSDLLRGVTDVLRLDARVPRRVNLVVHVPEDAPSGRYQGELQVHHHGRQARLALTVDVAAVQLPPVDRPVGVYLASPPHLSWFKAFALQRDTVLACDLATLREFGLSGVAPPLTTPSSRRELEFARDLVRAQLAGFQAPLLAYTPVKKLLEQGTDVMVEQLSKVQRGLAQAAIAAPLWSIADEPSNPGLGAPDPLVLAARLRSAAPGIRLAGHLNTPGDERFLSAFDVVLVNHGFGVDAGDVQRLRQRGVAPWLYNMPRQRMAAGFYLWRVGAVGYLQWHARMPTADPFDPTDGREGDYQMLYPSTQSCPPVPAIHGALLEMADGVLDLRWLLWLEQAAARDARARDLLSSLRAEVPDQWAQAERLSEEAAPRWRARITALARSLVTAQ